MSEKNRYATAATFGGQRASICRAVVVHHDACLSSGTIDSIDAESGAPWIHIPLHGIVTDDLAFHATSTEAEVDALPDGCWTWPVRL